MELQNDQKNRININNILNEKQLIDEQKQLDLIDKLTLNDIFDSFIFGESLTDNELKRIDGLMLYIYNIWFSFFNEISPEIFTFTLLTMLKKQIFNNFSKEENKIMWPKDNQNG